MVSFEHYGRMQPIVLTGISNSSVTLLILFQMYPVMKRVTRFPVILLL